MSKDAYENPLVARYATDAMKAVFSPAEKFGNWRKLWLALAEAEKELGLEQISDEALEQMRANLTNINYEVAEARERETRHDVMSHVYAFGQQCPAAAGIIHLGATSQFVNCNSDILMHRKALGLLIEKVLATISALADFAKEHAGVPCLGSTHFQVAQLTTVGKRATLWINDLLGDYYTLKGFAERTPLRGVKGTTGTQASYLTLFEGDHEKVKELDRKVCAKMGVDMPAFPVTGQTYSRKVDHMILSAVSGIGVTLHKMGADIRLLMGAGELEEPFGKNQIGSSAMAYKRNPMRSERMCSLARLLFSFADQSAQMASQQWLERTLDDSAVRRLIIPEAFLTADVVLGLAHNVASGLVVRKGTIDHRIAQNLPFMATEEIIMEHSRRGGDRQEAHEVIREASQEVITAVRETGAPNDLFERLKAHPEFAEMGEFIDGLKDAKRFIGRAEVQVEEFLAEHVSPLLEAAGSGAESASEVNV